MRFHNNRFRQMQVAQNGTGLYLEEKMAVTFYEFFRLMELMKDNVLEIEIPADCMDITLSVETGVTEIMVDGIHADQIHPKSSSGQIQIHDAYVGKMLSAHSVSGMVICYLSGALEDYDIDCRVEKGCPPAILCAKSGSEKKSHTAFQYVCAGTGILCGTIMIKTKEK